jgi:hypothetical protein
MVRTVSGLHARSGRGPTMNWGTFFLYLAQLVILCVVLFVVSAVIAGIISEVKGNHDDE